VQIGNWQRDWLGVSANFQTTNDEVPSIDHPEWEHLDFMVCLSVLNHYQCDPNRQRVGFGLFDVCLQAPVVFMDAPAPAEHCCSLRRS